MKATAVSSFSGLPLVSEMLCPLTLRVVRVKGARATEVRNGADSAVPDAEA